MGDLPRSHASVTTTDTNDAGHGMGDGVEYLIIPPELMSDDEHGDSSLATIQRASPKSSNGGGSAYMHDFLRCPECHHVLRRVFVEHTTANGEHHVHRCQAICTCETSGQWARLRRMDEYSSGMVQVNRGAW
jgi:hypothetical protein